MTAPYWNGLRLRALLDRADELIAGEGPGIWCRATLSQFGDEYDAVAGDYFEAFGWSRSCQATDDDQLEAVAGALAGELECMQSEHTRSTGGPSDSVDIYVRREQEQWTVGLWPRYRRAREP